MSDSLRVAFVDYVLDPEKPGRSGLSDMVWDMASELVNQGHRPHVIASYHTPVYPDPRVVVHNFPTPPIGYRNLAGQLWILKRAARIVQRLEPDVVHSPEYVSTAVLASLNVGRPLVLTVPGNIFYRLRLYEKDWCERYYSVVLKWAARVSARKCARVVAISREMKAWWEWTGSAPHKTPWIPLGVNGNRFHPVADARCRLGIPADTTLLLYVGRFSPEKGLGDLLDALSAIRQKLAERQVRVVLTGGGPIADALDRRLAAENLMGVVQTRRWVPQDELKVWYSAADAVLLPSWCEGFSRTIPEAMICGTPVIGTRISGTEDHVQDGLNGYLVPRANPAALARRIVSVADDPTQLRQMRPATLEYARQHLTWPGIMDRIVREVYRPAVAEAQAGHA